MLIARQDARPLEEGEYFLHDLVGLEVSLADGGRVGRVSEVYEGGATRFLAVDDGARELLIPFTRGIVREVDMEDRRITIAPPPGLLDI